MFRELPATPFEPCHKVATKVSSLSLVRYRTNDYSVPTRYGFRDVLVKGFVDEVVIFCDGVEIARHTRSYARDDFVFEPRHYLALLEQKPGALDQAAPLQGWIMPADASTFASAPGSAHGQTRQARVHPGLAADGGVSREPSSSAPRSTRYGSAPSASTRSSNSSSQELRTGPRVSIFPPIPICRQLNVKTTSPADYLTLVSREAA